MTLHISEIGVRLDVGEAVPPEDENPARDDTAATTADEIETIVRDDTQEVLDRLHRLDDR